MGEEPPMPGKGGLLVRYRVFLYSLLGLILLDGLIAANRRTWRSYEPDVIRARIDGCRRQRPELVLVGGSAVSEGIDPSVLSGVCWRGRSLERIYNLGLPGATAAEAWHAIAHNLPVPPSVLVYGITASDLNDNRLAPQGPRVLMDTGDLVNWCRYQRWSAAEWGVRHFLRARLGRLWNLMHYSNALRLCAADHGERLFPGLCPHAAREARANRDHREALRRPDGFAPNVNTQQGRLDLARAAGTIAPVFPFLENYRLGSHLKYLQRLLDWAEQRGVAVVLVDMPVSADLEERIHPHAFADYRKVLAAIEQTQGVRVLRAGRAAVGLDDADFADLIHLNAQGSARLSAWLREQLPGAAEQRGREETQ